MFFSEKYWYCYWQWYKYQYEILLLPPPSPSPRLAEPHFASHTIWVITLPSASPSVIILPSSGQPSIRSMSSSTVSSFPSCHLVDWEGALSSSAASSLPWCHLVDSVTIIPLLSSGEYWQETLSSRVFLFSSDNLNWEAAFSSSPTSSEASTAS